MKSIRFTLGLLNWLKHKQRPVQSVTERGCASRGASQISDNLCFAGRLSAISGNDATYGKTNINQPKHVSEARSNLKSDDWSSLGGKFNGAVSNLNSSYALTHRSILLYIDETGQAYDLTGQKWSRA